MGLWIQIQGDGAVLDMEETKLWAFLKPGDNTTEYQECNCSWCTNYVRRIFNPKTLPHQIKFKFE
jgi:hypothetical protein